MVDRHPLFVAALAVVLCVLAAKAGGAWGVLAVGVTVFWAWLVCGWKSALAWGVCGALAVAGFTRRTRDQATAERTLAGTHASGVRAKVLKDARGDRHWVAPAVLLDGDRAGRKVWWQGRGEAPVAGAMVMADGDFLPLPVRRNPGEFDRAAWLRSQGISAVFLAGKLDTKVSTGRWPLLGARIRSGFRDRVTAGLVEDSRDAQVIRAVVIGEPPPDAEAMIAAFRNSGTLHAFSVSGLHVAMVGSIGWFLLARLGVPRRWAVLALLPLIFGYSWITGNSAPAVRSAWMAAVFLGAFAFRRRPDLLNALGAVLLAAMLWDARLLFLPGVQLSYGVVAAIAVGTSWASRSFRWMEMPEMYLPESMLTPWRKRWLDWRRKVAQSLSVSLAAGVGSSPLTAFHFGLVTPVSVIAGLFLVPLVFMILATALIGVVISPLPPVSRLVNRLNGQIAAFSVFTAERFSAIPGGHWQVDREKRAGLWVYDLDHGAGAAVFSGGPGKAVLIDCADPRGFKQRLLPSMRRLGFEPDAVVLTHPDGDHLGGGAPVWTLLPIDKVLLPVGRSRSPAFRAWADDSPKSGVRTYQAASLKSLPFPDGAALEIVHAPDADAHHALADERVALYRLHWHGWKILFTSDAGMKTEQKALESGCDLSADVIVAGCHRDDVSLGDDFLDAVRPRAIVATNAAFPPSESRAPETLAYWKSRGIQVIDQAVTGGVTLLPDETGNLVIQGFLTPTPVVLTLPSP
jgi:competence protein ComEC